MNREFFLSVIIPVYNAEKYLPKCLDSIIAANIGDLELLIIDDGSNDGSASVCEKYVDYYPFVQLIQQENAGPSAARNHGLKKARGKYIAFMDADDYVDPDAFSHHIEVLREHDADIWVSDFRRVADNGCVLDEVFQIANTSEPITDSKYLETFLSAKDCVWNVWRYIFRRDFLLENQLLFSVGFNIAEDLEYVVKALSASKTVAFYHIPYYFYRVNYGATLTRRYTAQRVEQLMTMFCNATNVLESGALANLIKAKLAREYILNLSLYCELPRSDRAVALKALESAKGLMDNAAGVYSVVDKVVRLLGIKTSAWLLYQLKRYKRLMRSIKVRLFHRG